MPTLSQVHIDQALTNISIMYKNSSYIGDGVLPPFPVAKRSDKYFVYKKEMMLTPSPLDAQGRPTSLRRPGGEADEVDFGVDTKSFYAEEYAKRGLVTDAEVAYADNPLQPEIDRTRFLSGRLLLDNEVAVVGLVGKRANYPSSNKVTLTTGGSGTSWAQYASTNSAPFTDIKNGKLAVIHGIAMEANTFALSVDTARTLADHPDVKELVKYVHADALTTSGLPKVLRGLQTLEGAAQKNTASEGASFSGGNVWQADDGTAMALIAYVSPSPSLYDVTLGLTFDAPDDTTGVRGISTRKYREEKRKGTMVECAMLRDWKLIALDGSDLAVGGYLISSATV